MASYVSSWLWGTPTSSAPSSSLAITRTPSPTQYRRPTSYTLSSTSNEKELTPDEFLDALLEQYQSSSLPANSRFNGALDPQREGKPPSVMDLWQHAWFVATKTKDIVTSIASHHLHGPTRPTWNISMTLFSAFMRNMASNTHLIDVPTLRLAMSIGGLLPTPSDALITPVTFKVRRRGLRGFLKEWDEKEWDGGEAGAGKAREISAEWVVGKRTWARLQREWKGLQDQRVSAGRKSRGATGPAGSSGPATSRTSRAHHHSGKVKERVVLFLHGGAYYTASAATHRLITIQLSKHLDARVFSINYRLAPDTRFPGPVHDAASAWFRLTEDLGVPPGNIIIAGDSAGGGLSLALMLYLRDAGYPLPGGAILMCPWVDLTMSCASWDTNAPYDVITFPTDPADHMNPVACYLGPTGFSYITHPYASPLFGSFHGLPPMLIQAGDCEVLRDEVTLLAHKASQQGVQVRHELYEDAVHVFQMWPFLDQSKKAFRSARKWVFEELPRVQGLEREKEKEERAKAKATSRSGVESSTESDRDVGAVSPTTTRSRSRSTSLVSPPLTPPTRASQLPLSPPAPESQSRPSIAMSSPSPSSASDEDALLDSLVETALEREIRGSGIGKPKPVVVNAYGGEDDTKDSASSPSGAATSSEAIERLGSTADGEVMEDSSDSEEDATEEVGGDQEADARFDHASPSASPLAYSGPPVVTSPSGSRGSRTKSSSIVASSAPLVTSPQPLPPSSPSLSFSYYSSRARSSSSISAQSAARPSATRSTSSSTIRSSSSHVNANGRNHTRSRTGSGAMMGSSSLIFTPVERAPAVPEARSRGGSLSSTTGPLNGDGGESTAHLGRPASSSHINLTKIGRMATSPSGSHSNLSNLTPDFARSRTMSHPDIVKLMQDYARSGPAQVTTTYTAANSPTKGRSRAGSRS